MTNVQNTLVSALPSGAQAAYPREFEAVVTALNEREYRLTDLIAGEVSRRLGVTEATSLPPQAWPSVPPRSRSRCPT
jgi:hypothetical protein